VRRHAVSAPRDQRLRRKRSPPTTHMSPRPAPEKGEEWGRYKQKVDQIEKRLEHLGTLVERWWQVTVAGLFGLAGYLLVRLLG
jgi:hypothetical protein